MKHASLPLSLVGLVALAACTAQPPLVTHCPNVAVLEQGSSMTAFLPGRQDVAAQIARARITGVAGSCTLEPKRHLLRVVFQAGFAATSGPANTSQNLVLPYLISLSQGDNILSVANGSITLSFAGNATTATATSKPIKYEFPDTADAANTDVLISFHLSPDQLAYNQAHQNQ